MSKIICDVCGTSYPDTATQCPICGCVRSADAQGVSADELDMQGSGGYTYVKGGRFSKANVKKRSHSSQRKDYETFEQEEPVPEKEEKGSTGLLIVAILLLLAIVAVVIYIALHFFGSAPETPTLAPPVSTSQNVPETTVSVETTVGVETTVPSAVTIPCQSVSLDVSAITFQTQGAARMLYASVLPANTTDAILYSSSNPRVVAVTPDGKAVAVGPGQATIMVICGQAVFTCTVDCAFEEPTTEPTVPPTVETTPPKEEFTLNRKDITFKSKGESWTIYSGTLALSQITWTSDNEDVATIKNGKVVAVGSGITTVYGEYNGEKVGCIIRCSFNDGDDTPGVGGTGGVTEDGGSSDTTGEGYRLKNMVGGRNDDVTIQVGYAFSLQLVDGQGNAVSSVEWSSSNSSVCTVEDGKVTGVAAGLATITASYEGKEYKCIIHVS